MITKYDNYLLLEKSNLSSIGIPKDFIKYIYENLPNEYKLSDAIKIEEIDIDTFKEEMDEYYFGLFLLKSDYDIMLLIKGESIEVFDIMIYKIVNKKSRCLYNVFVHDVKLYMSNCHTIYNLEYKIHADNFILEDFIIAEFNKIYKKLFLKIKDFYVSEIYKEISIYENDLNKNSEYLSVLSTDNLKLNQFDYLYNNDLLILVRQCISKDNYEIYSHRYNEQYMLKIYKYIANRLFKTINNYSKFIKQKYYEIDIDNNNNLYSIYKKLIIKPELINKYIHLDDANKFDLI